MDKPITVMRKEFTDNLVEVINTSGLPAFVMREVVGVVYKELQKGEDEQLKNDLAAWEKSNEEAEEENASGKEE